VTGEVHDYRRKGGVEAAEILLPNGVAGATWAQDREALWNAAEAAEGRPDSRVAREYEVALPSELTPAQRLELTREFGQELAERFGVAVDFAIHQPHREGDVRNHHAHILTTTRKVGEAGLLDKATPELSDTKRMKKNLGRSKAEVNELRKRWAELANAALARHGYESRIDHRSHAAQGIDRRPGTHLGPVVMERLRRGKDSTVLQRIEGEAATEALEAIQRGRLGRELRAESEQLDRAIVDTTTSLKEALAARVRGLAKPVPESVDSIQQRQRASAQRWVERRAGRQAPEAGNPDTFRERGLIIPGEERERARAARLLGPDGREL
jgi:hypothetical protein